MKKRILKILSVIAAFVLGLLFMGRRMTAGNDDLMDSMAEATLPLVSFVIDGTEMNTMHGYVGEMDGQTIRGDVVPLSDDRVLSVVVDPYKTQVAHICYEVRSLDHQRLIEDTEVSYTLENNRLLADFPIKNLLDDGKEYALIVQLETKEGNVISYYSRIANIGETRLKECLDFAFIWHDATFDKANTVSITKYLESDSQTDNDTLEEVTIHSKYKQIIWDQMEMLPYSEVDVTVTEIEPAISSLRLDFVTQYENSSGTAEYYEVQEYFRIRHTDQRVYLLDYERTANRVFDADTGIFGTSQLELGILDEGVHYKKNEEENIVAFVQNKELWVYDHARNTLSYVMGFRDEWDTRSNFPEHDIRIMHVDESGSMEFLVYGYMNRGIHEGTSGIAVYYYDALANTVEELAFLKSRKPYEVLREDLGDLSFVTGEKELYLYLEGSLYGLDLTTRELSVVAKQLTEERFLLSEDQSLIAWQTGNSLLEADEIVLLNLLTGIEQTIEAKEGEYIRGLGFMGTDFIWGAANAEDVQVDLLGNITFPMHTITIQSMEGDVIREFPYGDQEKYVISVSMEDNRISMQCVARDTRGNYVNATPEPITNKSEEKKEKIELKTKNTAKKKREYVLAFANPREEEKPTRLAPKQVLFEVSRTLQLLEEKPERYYVYARGRIMGSYAKVSEAVVAADGFMGVVTDSAQQVIWNRTGRKNRVQITEIEERKTEAEESSLEVCLNSLLGYEAVYPDVKNDLEEGKSVTEILETYLEGPVMNLSGCDLSTVLYYVSEGKPAVALTGQREGVLIVGYDPQNVILMDPASGKIFKKGMNDSRAYFEGHGNRFVAYME